MTEKKNTNNENVDDKLDAIKREILQDRIEREKKLSSMTSEELAEYYKNLNKTVDEIDKLLGINTCTIREFYERLNNEKHGEKRVFIVTNKEPKKEYFDALKKAGINYEWGDATTRIEIFDGLLIPGGVDVNPKLYGQENIASEPPDDVLDEITMKAIKLFFENGKAILGICRGLQILNVYFVGTLKQDIPNHKNIDHKIKLEKDSILQKYYGNEMVVNSIHHQCIDKLGSGLSPIAYAEDGVIEAFIHKNNKIIGTQFHPERMQNGEKIFEIFNTML